MRIPRLLVFYPFDLNHIFPTINIVPVGPTCLATGVNGDSTGNACEIDESWFQSVAQPGPLCPRRENEGGRWGEVGMGDWIPQTKREAHNQGGVIRRVRDDKLRTETGRGSGPHATYQGWWVGHVARALPDC
ncbi:unnamed protein product [Musa hybrid cultivar]